MVSTVITHLVLQSFCNPVAIAHAVHLDQKIPPDKSKDCSCSQPISGAAGSIMNCGSAEIPYRMRRRKFGVRKTVCAGKSHCSS